MTPDRIYQINDFTYDFQAYYPEHLWSGKWLAEGYNTELTTEQRLSHSHQLRTQEFATILIAEQDQVKYQVALYQVYLSFCHKLPFYGAAMFRGQIGHPGKSGFMWGDQDDPVFVAVNLEGISILDMDDVRFLIFLRYRHFTWDYYPPAQKENPNRIPCVAIKFDDGLGNWKLLQIFTKEAPLINAMLTTCRKALNKNEKVQKVQNADETWGGGKAQKAPPADSIVKSHGQVWERFERICLKTIPKTMRY